MSPATNDIYKFGSKKERHELIVRKFNDYFGEPTKLQNWQKLCTVLRIEGPPTSIKQCRKQLKKTSVNIWDLMEAIDNETEVKIWRSKSALVEYTIKSGKTFPKAMAKNGGPIKELLAQIH